jgi:uncharacterized alpha-E superfamily protein
VADFLLLHPALPNSVHHTLGRAWNFLARIRGRGENSFGKESSRRLKLLFDDVKTLDMSRIEREGIHEVLTQIVSRTSEVSSAIRDDYFLMALPKPSTRRSKASP